MDFQTFSVRGQVNFNYWIEEFILSYFKAFSFFSGWEHVPVVGTGKDVAILDSYEYVTYQR
jgi:hypothetical protein